MISKCTTVTKNSDGSHSFGTTAINLDHISSVEPSYTGTRDLHEWNSTLENALDSRAEVFTIHMNNGLSYEVVGNFDRFVETYTRNKQQKLLLG